MLDLIKREPVKFAGFVLALLNSALQMAQEYGLSAGSAASLNIALTLGVSWLVAAVVVPTVKLSNETINEASTMTREDIAVVAATKAEGKP